MQANRYNYFNIVWKVRLFVLPNMTRHLSTNKCQQAIIVAWMTIIIIYKTISIRHIAGIFFFAQLESNIVDMHGGKVRGHNNMAAMRNNFVEILIKWPQRFTFIEIISNERNKNKIQASNPLFSVLGLEPAQLQASNQLDLDKEQTKLCRSRSYWDMDHVNFSD